MRGARGWGRGECEKNRDWKNVIVLLNFYELFGKFKLCGGIVGIICWE